MPPVVEVNQPSNWWPAFVGAAGRVIAEPLRNVESGMELPPSSSYETLSVAATHCAYRDVLAAKA